MIEWKRATIGFSGIAVAACCTLGCQEGQATPGEKKAASEAAPADVAQAAPNRKDAPATPGEKKAAQAAPGDCYAGKWTVDYTDESLNPMIKAIPGAKVTKQEGKMVCDWDSGKKGRIDCTTGGTPVVTEFEMSQGGMKMVTTMTMNGEVSCDFTVVSPGVMEYSNEDASKWEFSVTGSMNGKPMPMLGGAQKQIGFFSNADGTMLVSKFQCEGDKLGVKYEESPGKYPDAWSYMKRVK